MSQNYQTVKNSLKKHTDPNIITHLMSILQPNDQTISSDVPKQIDIAMHDQNEIGYSQIFNGRIATSWISAQKAYLHHCSHHGAPTPDRWVLKLLKALLRFAHDVWIQRNNFNNHGETITPASNTERLNSQIRRIHAQGCTTVPVIDRHRFPIPITFLLQTNLSSKRQWLEAVTHSQKMFAESMFNQQRIQPRITSYFKHINLQST